MGAPLEIVVDAMGGDTITENGRARPPYARITEAVSRFLAAQQGINIVLVGNKDTLEEAMAEHYAIGSRITLIHAPYRFDALGGMIDVHGIPQKEGVAISLRTYTSAYVMFNEQRAKEGQVIGYLSLGHTGHTLMEATKGLGRMKSGERKITPGICAPNPYGMERRFVIDAGMTDIPDENFPIKLYHWPLLARAYVQSLGYPTPSTRLLSTGEGLEKKGGKPRRDAHDFLLRVRDIICYEGLVEPNDITKKQGHDGDIILADGFTGNITIKAKSGTAKDIGELLKQGMRRNFATRILGPLYKLAGGFEPVKESYNPDRYASIVLGIKGIVSKGHGISPTSAIYHNLEYLAMIGRTQLLPKLFTAIEEHRLPTP